MDDFVLENLSRSAIDFRDKVWPVIAEACGGGDLHPVEAVSDRQFAEILDLQAGIDGWQAVGGGLRGIASRVQYRVVYPSFTIRYRLASGNETEFDKRVRALEERSEGWIAPHFTVQAYLLDPDDQAPAYICMMKTEDLFHYVLTHREEVVERSAEGGNVFLVAWVSGIQHAGCEVWEWGEADVESDDDDYYYSDQCPYCGEWAMGGMCLTCGSVI